MPLPFWLMACLLVAVPGGAPLATKVPEPAIPYEPEFYVCHKAQAALNIDGVLDEPSWRKARWTERFVDIEGAIRPRPRFSTRVKMVWDDGYFYVGAELEEPHVWATLTERDSIIFNDNDFEVFIDPDGDTHTYFELEINALNTVWDLLLVRPYRDGGPAVHAWDIQGLKTAVAVNGTLNDSDDKDKGWTIEIAIPLAVISEGLPGKKLPEPGDIWRVNFSRVEYRVQADKGGYVKAKDPKNGLPYPEDNWVWSPQGVINIHYPEMWGSVQFTGTTVGKKNELFWEDFDDPVKWALRRIYYKEWAYRAVHGSFSPDLGAIGFRAEKIVDWDRPPQVQTTDSLFEAVYKNGEGISWHIRQDGFLWKESAEKKE